MREAFIESAHLKRNRDLFHHFYRSDFIIILYGVNNNVLVIFFELVIFLLKIVEIIEEWEQWREKLVAIMFLSCRNFTLFKLFFLIVINLRFATQSINYFSVVLDVEFVILINGGLEFFNLVVHFFYVLYQSLLWFGKVFNELCYLETEDLARVTCDFSSDFWDGMNNIFVVFSCIN